MSQTQIEWADKVWNPITGCSPISEGCKNCYAKRMAYRLKGRYGYPKDNPFKVTFHPDRLDEPLRWKKPCRIFVCSMGDLFHENVSNGFLFSIFGIMASEEVGHHSFFVLTKRPKRMADWIKQYSDFNIDPVKLFERVWLGISIEDQETADERIPILLQIPAAKRFVSVEPMLGPMDFNKLPDMGPCSSECIEFKECRETQKWICHQHRKHENQRIDWVICGGETGPHARPIHPDWVRSLRDQCQAAGVPFFFKGWGEWRPSIATLIKGKYTGGGIYLKSDGTKGCQGDWWDGKAVAMDKMKGKKAGRLLDGREWNEISKGSD